MNILKLSLGIILPLFLIILLISLSLINPGLEVNKITEKSVSFNSIFVSQNSPKNDVLVQTISLSNEFFPRKFEIPRLTACLSNKENKENKENLRIKYSEEIYSKNSNIPIFEEIFFDVQSSTKPSIEISIGSKKQIKIMVEPKDLYNYNSSINSYKEYDEVLLIESSSGNFYSSYYDTYSCNYINQKELDSAIHIPIIK